MNSTYTVGVGALILTAIFYHQLDGVPSVAQRLPGLLIWIVAILAVLMIIEETLKQRRLRKESAASASTSAARVSEPDDLAQTPPTADNEDAPLDPINWKVFIAFSVALVAYVWLIPIAGYLITTVVFMGGVLLFSGTIRPITAILASLGLTAFVWLVFVWALGLPVPLLPWLN